MVIVDAVREGSRAPRATATPTSTPAPTTTEGVLGLSIRVTGSGLVDDVAQISPDTWTFTADANLNGVAANPDDGLLVTFTTARTALSGLFEITGRILTVEF